MDGVGIRLKPAIAEPRSIGKKQDSMGNGRLFRLRWGRRSVRYRRLLRCDEVGTVRRIQPTRPSRGALHGGRGLPPDKGLCKMGAIKMTGRVLRHGVRPASGSEQAAPLIQLSGLFGETGLSQRSGGIGELLRLQVDIRLQREQLVLQWFPAASARRA